MSVARPSRSCSTAKLVLMPAPLISRPCSYSRRTEGPMPFGQTAITLMFAGNFSPAVDLDARALERFAQVLSLRRALRAPADDADLLDARERLRQQAEKVPPAAQEALLDAVELDRLHVEDLRLEQVRLALGAGGRAHSAAG